MERIAKLAAFSALAVAFCAPLAHAGQEPQADPAQSEATQAKAQAQAARARAFLSRFLTPRSHDAEIAHPAQAQQQTQREAEASAARSRAALEGFFRKTPGQAAHSAAQTALGAGAAVAGAAHDGLLRLKGKLAAKPAPAQEQANAPAAPSPAKP